MEEALDSRTKGLPHVATDVRLSEVSARRWNVLNEDLPLPLALLRDSALANNRRWMREFLARTGTKLAPHGKTYMSPQIFKWQLQDGAWAITLSTLQQVRVARSAGINRILLANPVVGPRDIAYVLESLLSNPVFDFRCLVDSVAGVKRLAEAAKSSAPGRPLKVLLEIGYPGGRTGCRDLESARSVAKAVKRAEPFLLLEGIEGFEGLHGYLPASDGVPKVCDFLDKMVQVAGTLDVEDLFGTEEIILSAGGSAYYDLVSDILGRANLSRKASIVLRGGCYLTHDAGWYERLFSDVLDRSSIAREISGRLENAFEVLAYVISVPEDGRAILGAGRRDFGHDAGPPVPLKHFRPGSSSQPVLLSRRYEIVGINDQHAHLSLPPSADIRIGDMVALGVSHPCTTFDKWQLVHIVDDLYNIVSSIRTYF
jgi:D-serine dehydratase